MNIMNFPTAEQMAEKVLVLKDIANKISPAYKLESWEDVQACVRRGTASKYLSIGDQIMAIFNGTPRVWDVIGIDKDTPAKSAFTHSLTIQSHDILMNGRISAPEAMYNAVAELPAGTQIFTTNGLKYQVTTTQAIPPGGIMYIATRADYVPLTINTYDIDRVTLIESGLVVTPATGTDTLTPINDYIRMRYGNNNYLISAVRQFLNSNKTTFNWQPMGLYDMPSTYSGTGGFLNQLDPELVAVLGSVEKRVAKATYDGGGQDVFNDKVFLLSRKEMGYGDEGDVTGEFVYPFWDGASNADRIKGSPSYWWLRSPYVSHASHARNVNPSGALNYSGALSSYGLAPACVII